jgi:hypothetical protein
MTDTVSTALIGAVSAIVGSACTVLTARVQAKQNAKQASEAEATDNAKPSLVLGELIDIRELRILRALYGEPSGRILQAYRAEYYRPALETAVKKGWIEEVHGGKLRMTPNGVSVCREYLKQLETWKPV